MSIFRRDERSRACATTQDPASGELLALQRLLEREADSIARATAGPDARCEAATSARIEEAAAGLSTVLLSDITSEGGELGIRDLVLDACGLVELAAERAIALDEAFRCCLAWRRATIATLERGVACRELDARAAARAAMLTWDVFDEVVTRVCGSVEAERRDTGERLHFLATHDPLTGLANRSLFAERLERLARRPPGEPVALVFVDLDDFKTVNDTLGHAAGDELLIEAAKRLLANTRVGDLIARLGGDEFVVAVEAATGQQAPELVAQRLLEAFREPFILAAGTASLRVTASIGIASSDWSAPQTLLRDADLSMYRAKALGKDRAELTCRQAARGSQSLSAPGRHA